MASTQYTTLSNGVTVVSEADAAAPTATVGVYTKAGSRLETEYLNGSAAVLLKALAAGAAKAAAAEGVLLTSEVGRETLAVVGVSTDAAKAAAAVAKAVSAPQFSDAVLSAAKASVLAAADAIEANPNAAVLEHLYATAYQGTGFGLPVNGTSDSVPLLQVSDVEAFYGKNYKAGSTVVAAAGNVNHDALVEAIEKQLSLASGSAPVASPATFLGSEVRFRDDTLPKAHFAIAVKGELLASPDYYVAQVAAALLGNFRSTDPVLRLSGAKLAQIVQDYHIVDNYTHFLNLYADTGLWGFAAETLAIESIDDLVHFTLKEWNRLLVLITDAEVSRAKNVAKTALLAKLSLPSAIVLDLGLRTLLTDRKELADLILALIDAITTADVTKWAQTKVYDQDFALSGTGQIEGLFDYLRIRNDMSMMRW